MEDLRRVLLWASEDDGLAYLEGTAACHEGVPADEVDRAVEIRGVEDGVAICRALGGTVGHRIGADGLGLAEWCAAPRGFQVENSPVAKFHVVLRGSAVLTLGGDPVAVTRGELVLLPHGDGHVMQDQPG